MAAPPPMPPQLPPDQYRIVVDMISRELAKGTKHFRLSDGKMVNDPNEIIAALRANDLGVSYVCNSCGGDLGFMAPMEQRICTNCRQGKKSSV